MCYNNEISVKNKKEKDNSLVKIDGIPTKYDYTNRLHRNIAIGEILDVIDKIILLIYFIINRINCVLITS